MSSKVVSAVILAGTHPWSGSAFEALAPRPLVPVALAPVISYSLRWLQRGGVRQATICANGSTRAIKAAFGDGRLLGMDLGYYKDGTPRGAAGCVRDAGLPVDSQTFVIADGAAVPTVDLAELLAAHHLSGAAVTAVVHRQRTASGPLAPGGVYVFERRVLDHIGETGFQDIKENLIPRLRRAGERVAAHESGGFCPHVLNAETYLAVNHWMVQRLAAGASHGDPLVHPTAVVAAGARIVGPVQLGAGAVVEAGATIVGPASIGPDSTVCGDALVARSVLWRGCVVGAAAVVHGCIVGSGAVIPAAMHLFNAVRPSASSFLAAEPARAVRVAGSLPAPSPGISSPRSCTAA